MINPEQITEIGSFNQPHGIKGELNAAIFENVAVEDLSCIILDIDGIFVPFFITGIRPRGARSYLVTVEGIDSEHDASAIANKRIYALKDEARQLLTDDNADGFYVEDLIGFGISTPDGTLNGTVADIDDSTENILFIVKADDGKTHLIPVADEFITEIDADNRQIIMALPDGLLDI